MRVAATGQGTLRGALGEVLGSPARAAGFVAVSAAVALVYSFLLPFAYTQRLELANWGYLDARMAGWAIVLGAGMGLVVSLQVYAMRRVAAARSRSGATGGLAFVASLMPSFLCCTPVIPTLLAFVGVSGVGLYGTTGALQHFFAVYENEFLAVSAALLGVTAWWGLREVVNAGCLSEDGCQVDAGGAAVAARPPDIDAVEQGTLR